MTQIGPSDPAFCRLGLKPFELGHAMCDAEIRGAVASVARGVDHSEVLLVAGALIETSLGTLERVRLTLGGRTTGGHDR